MLEPALERVGSVEGEHLSRSRVGVQQVGEPGLDAGRLVEERQRTHDLGERVGKAVGVLARLPGDAREGGADRLGFDRPGSTTVDEAQVVGAPVRSLHDELADGDASRRDQVHRRVVLHRPSRRHEHSVDGDTSTSLGRQVVLGCRGAVVHGPRVRRAASWSPHNPRQRGMPRPRHGAGEPLVPAIRLLDDKRPSHLVLCPLGEVGQRVLNGAGTESWKSVRRAARARLSRAVEIFPVADRKPTRGWP